MFPGGSMAKNLPAIQETWVQSLGQEDPLEKEGNGNPLQYSCLENSVDRGAWQATVHGITKTQLRRLGAHTCKEMCISAKLTSSEL